MLAWLIVIALMGFCGLLAAGFIYLLEHHENVLLFILAVPLLSALALIGHYIVAGVLAGRTG